MNDSLDLTHYFERVGHDGDTAATVSTLNALTGAHTRSIPFENVAPMLGQPVSLKPEALYRKLVLERRGGYCFEQNGLFMAVLERLGFRVRPLRAGVRLGQPDRNRPVGHTHLVLQVLIDGNAWITDVGVGSTSLTCALRQLPDVEQPTPHEPRRLVRADGRWFHQVRRGDEWVDVYEFGGEDMSMPDRVIANWYASTHPQSKFRRDLIAARALPEGRRVSLENRKLTLREADGSARRKTLDDTHDLLAVLREQFGIRLPDTTRFDLPAADTG